jgi:hypothetical protein
MKSAGGYAVGWYRAIDEPTWLSLFSLAASRPDGVGGVLQRFVRMRTRQLELHLLFTGAVGW